MKVITILSQKNDWLSSRSFAASYLRSFRRSSGDERGVAQHQSNVQSVAILIASLFRTTGQGTLQSAMQHLWYQPSGIDLSAGAPQCYDASADPIECHRAAQVS